VDIGRLPDALARRIGAFLRQRGRMTGPSRASLALSLAGEAVPFVAPAPPAAPGPEAFLEALIAERRDRELRRLETAVGRSRELGRRINALPFDH
jgi:hypothetical protein